MNQPEIWNLEFVTILSFSFFSVLGDHHDH
jgi:hypothetical protein